LAHDFSSHENLQYSHDNRLELFLKCFSLISLVCQTLVHMKHWLCSNPLSSFHSRRCPLFPHTHKQTQAFYFLRCTGILSILSMWAVCVSVRMTECWWCLLCLWPISNNNDSCPFSVCHVLAWMADLVINHVQNNK